MMVDDGQVSLTPAFDWATKTNDPEPAHELEPPCSSARRSSVSGQRRNVQKPRQQDLRIMFDVPGASDFEEGMPSAPECSLTAAYDLVMSPETTTDMVELRVEQSTKSPPNSIRINFLCIHVEFWVEQSTLKAARRQKKGTVLKRLGKAKQHDLRIALGVAEQKKFEAQATVVSQSSLTEAIDALFSEPERERAEQQVQESEAERARVLASPAVVYAMRAEALAKAEASASELESLRARLAAVPAQVALAGTIPQAKLDAAKRKAKTEALEEGKSETDALLQSISSLEALLTEAKDRTEFEKTVEMQVQEFHSLQAEEAVLTKQLQQTKARLEERKQQTETDSRPTSPRRGSLLETAMSYIWGESSPDQNGASDTDQNGKNENEPVTPVKEPSPEKLVETQKKMAENQKKMVEAATWNQQNNKMTNFNDAIAQRRSEVDEFGTSWESAGNGSAPSPVVKLPVALMFPNQGSETVGMIGSSESNEMFALANQILGYDILELCQSGPVDILKGTAYAQPAVYIAGLCATEQLRKMHPEKVDGCQAVAGLGVGELTALTVAGVMDFETGLRLVKVRGEAMAEAAMHAKATSLLMVNGLSLAEVQDLCEETRKKEGPDAICDVASVLLQNGFTCVGTDSAIARLKVLVETSPPKGSKIMAKFVDGFPSMLAFQTEGMAPAQTKFRAALMEALPKMKPPRCTVYFNSTASAFPAGSSPSKMMDAIASQITSTVLWVPEVQQMLKDGVLHFYELGPGRQLKSLMRQISNDAWRNTRSIAP